MYKKALLVASAATFMALLASPAQAGNCRDPWITQAIREVTGREPNGSGETGECTYTQYGGGQWGPYSQLKGFVQQKFNKLPTADLNMQFARQTVKPSISAVSKYRLFAGKVQFAYAGKWFYLIGNDGSTLIGNDSAGLVGNDGASLLPQGAMLKVRP